MNENKNGLVERILKELNHVLSIPGLTEFDIVPSESNTNKSPVLYEETSVGLQSWCVKHVYLQCYTELMDNYLTYPKKRLSRPSNERLNLLLNATLLLNSDITTLWNKKREMFDEKFLELSSELQFSRLVISRKPKCNDAFAYRRYFLEKVLKEGVLEYQVINNLFVEELAVCNMAADKCPNNYHCWDHRRWLMMTGLSLGLGSAYTFLLLNEYRFIHQWSSNHVSDYSCFHYFQFCLKSLYHVDKKTWYLFKKAMQVDYRGNFENIIAAHLPHDPTVKPTITFMKTVEEDDLIALMLGNCPGNCKCHSSYAAIWLRFEILFYELIVNNDLLKYYKYHETLWYHRRFIVHEILATMYDHLEVERRNGKLQKKDIQASPDRKYKCQDCLASDLKQHNGKVEKYDSSWVYHSPLFKVLIKHEKEFIKDRWKDSDKYADKHDYYLKHVEGIKVFM